MNNLRAVASADTVEVYGGTQRFSFTRDEAEHLEWSLRRALRKREPFRIWSAVVAYRIGWTAGLRVARTMGRVR